MNYADDFLKSHKLRCANCNTIFTTVLPKISVFRGRVKCPKCHGNAHFILDDEIDLRPDFLPKTLNIPMCRTSSDMYDSLMYAALEAQNRYKKGFPYDGMGMTISATYMDDLDPIKKYFNTEENNMKRTTNNNEETRNFEIVRKYSTERGIFTVGQLEPTDMFVLIDDEEQTVFMAVYEEEPKYKTKKAVVNMQTGDLWYFDIVTKIHVYRPGSSELRVGEFLYSSKDYK